MSDIVELELPEILDLPPKILPMLTDFDKYDYFLIEGGRGSAKTQSAGRGILYIGEKNEVRVVCGRETQANLEESVHAVLKDLIETKELAYDVTNKHIRHKMGGTEIRFKGFRDQGKVKIKGLEAVDILWIDEAETVTMDTLNTIIPTIRKANAKIVFTMNRHLRSDAVPTFMTGRKDCLHIKINYFDNPHCPLKIKVEAEVMRIKNPKMYGHIYLGEPLEQADDHLFSHKKLWEAVGKEPWGENFPTRQRAMGIDWASGGEDLCVATILDRVTNTTWKVTERVSWNDSDPMYSIGKIVTLMNTFKPDVTGLDIGGQGYVVAGRLEELEKTVYCYDGGTTDGVDTSLFANLRAQEYFALNDEFDAGNIIIDEKDKEIVEEGEKIKFRYRSNGVRIMQSKQEMKADPEVGFSPDNMDSLKIAAWVRKFIGTSTNSHSQASTNVVRRSSRTSRGRSPSVPVRKR